MRFKYGVHTDTDYLNQDFTDVSFERGEESHAATFRYILHCLDVCGFGLEYIDYHTYNIEIIDVLKFDELHAMTGNCEVQFMQRGMVKTGDSKAEVVPTGKFL